uniref:Uncharacterized protein n=1 Tax=Arundo donax TaxID=35708 RepID=A0A0A9BZQ8_ARUDO
MSLPLSHCYLTRVDEIRHRRLGSRARRHTGRQCAGWPCLGW